MKDTALVTHIFPLAKSFRNDYFLLQVRQKIANNYKYVKKTNTGQNTAGVKWGCGNPVGILKKERCKTSLQKKKQCLSTSEMKKFSIVPRRNPSFPWRNIPSYSNVPVITVLSLCTWVWLCPFPAPSGCWILLSLLCFHQTKPTNPALSFPHVSCAPAPIISVTLLCTH